MPDGLEWAIEASSRAIRLSPAQVMYASFDVHIRGFHLHVRVLTIVDLVGHSSLLLPGWHPTANRQDPERHGCTV